MIAYFIALPEDFAILENADNSTEQCKTFACSENSINQSIGNFTNAKDCLLNCAAEENCTYCIKVCNAAVIDGCGQGGRSNTTTKKILSKKPGKVTE